MFTRLRQFWQAAGIIITSVKREEMVFKNPALIYLNIGLDKGSILTFGPFYAGVWNA
jgi:hypothetical protein